MNIAVMRVFVRLREMLATHRELAIKLRDLERRIQGHDQQIQAVFQAIRALMKPPEGPRRRIGFEVEERRAGYARRRTGKGS